MDKIIQIKYQVLDYGEGPTCCPMEILPKRVPIGDYNIVFCKDRMQITDIRNKQSGMVKFK